MTANLTDLLTIMTAIIVEVKVVTIRVMSREKSKKDSETGISQKPLEFADQEHSNFDSEVTIWSLVTSMRISLKSAACSE